MKTLTRSYCSILGVDEDDMMLAQQGNEREARRGGVEEKKAIDQY